MWLIILSSTPTLPTPTSHLHLPLFSLLLAVMPPIVVQHFNHLWFIAVDDQLKVILEPFQLPIPQEDECDTIFTHLRIAFPLLRGKHQTAYHLLKSRSSNIPTDQSLRDQLSHEQVNRRALLQRSNVVRKQFPAVRQNTPGHVNVIIYLIEKELGAYYFILLANVFDTLPQ